MEYNNYEVIDSESKVTELSRTFFANVYKYMFLALSVSGLVSWYASTQMWYIEMMYNETGLSPLGYVIIFSPLALVLLIQARVNKFSYGTVFVLYLLYAFLIGISFASIFLIYTSSSIFLTFSVTAGAFGSMALLGYFTKTDLSKMGSLLYMVFFGIIITSIINVFLGSDMISWVISLLGLVVFTGLTAWEMQRMKAIASDMSITGDDRKKRELLGGLTLYILFINLFLSILRFVGDRG
jgi:FtsH-binding integral membrane protein